MSRASLVLAIVLLLPVAAPAAGIPLVDASGAPHGSVSMKLSRGSIVLRIAGLAPLPAAVTGGAGAFTAYLYKAYIASSADPAIEIFLGDVYPNAKQKAVRKAALAGDVSHMGFDRVTVTAFSKDGLQSFDVLTATFAP